MAKRNQKATIEPSVMTSDKKTRGKRSEKPTLSASLIENAKPQARSYCIWDREEEGFGVRITPTGGKSYVVKLLVKGKQVWKTIGKISKREKKVGGVHQPKSDAVSEDAAQATGDSKATLTVAEARSLAKSYRSKAREGFDPNAETRERKTAPTVAFLVDKFIDEYVNTIKLGEGSRPGYTRHLRKIIAPRLGNLLIRKIDSDDVSAFHHALRNTPRQANQALAILRKMLNQAEVWKLRPEKSNPCIHIVKYPEDPRERFLLPEELAALGEVLRDATSKYAIPPAALAALRLLIFTGARHNEILKLQWRQVNLAKRHLIYSRTEHKTGKKKGPKKIPLSTPAIRVLESIDPVPGNPYVIVGDVPGKHFVGLQKVWERIRKQVSINEAKKVEEGKKEESECVNIEDVRIHDLRHTFASVGASDGQSLVVIGSVLGHSQPSVTNRYAHLQDDPRHEVAETISDIIATSLGEGIGLLPTPGGEVPA
jgi:integrase